MEIPLCHSWNSYAYHELGILKLEPRYEKYNVEQ